MNDDFAALTPEQALDLTQRGAMIVCIDVPEGHEFGLDLRTYGVGPRFRGMKMIPPGTHLLVSGTEMDHQGVFLKLEAGEVAVFRWDPNTEMLALAKQSEQESCTAAARRLELDSQLGPYPLNTSAEWQALSQLVSADVLARAGGERRAPVPCSFLLRCSLPCCRQECRSTA